MNGSYKNSSHLQHEFRLKYKYYKPNNSLIQSTLAGYYFYLLLGCVINMSKGYQNELAKNALVEIVKVIIEAENKINSTIDDGLRELLNDISNNFDVGIGNEILQEVENSIIHTNCVGELFFDGDKGYRKCRRETSYNKLDEIVVHTASKNNCVKDAFFSEIFITEHGCRVNG